MSRYETYKPSGIEWIGDIPKDWKVVSLKNILLSMTNGTTVTQDPFEEGIPVTRIETISDGTINIENTGIIPSDKGIEDYYLNNGDILFSHINSFEYVANCAIFDLDIKLLHGMNLLRFIPNKNRIEPYFLIYLIKSDYFKKLTQSVCNRAINQVSISNSKLKNFKIVIPEDKSEQLAIANYLDDQTQKIDRLIANKKAQAEKLKELRQIEINNAVTKGLNANAEMKDSGIEWLGKIPKYWEVNRLKNTTFINQSVISEKTTPEYLIKYIDISNVNSMGEFIELQEMEFSEAPSRARRIPKHNSILLSTVRTYLRAIALVQNPDENLIASTGFAVIDANENIFDAGYLYYQMISHILVERVIANSEGVSYPAISSTKLGDIKIVIPPKKEQTEIANYLQQRTTAIDQLIKNIEAQIEKLQELRKIKIYEAVTGKIKVNAYAETTA
ncbi:restriction endonuclease subunit S [Proteiniphilum sp.]|uniref:restriction endonuclease subunit S n=1 Tax=Proteiniphilum sp. TaxID=1926877 RepID=UPI002B1F96C5|nr:restriction endonuclease subunit S [Proteiniphilum sp.]MEA4917290.1 restriction endonuclease subunit S [Proteiniphilum sp.]